MSHESLCGPGSFSGHNFLGTGENLDLHAARYAIRSHYNPSVHDPLGFSHATLVPLFMLWIFVEHLFVTRHHSQSSCVVGDITTYRCAGHDGI